MNQIVNYKNDPNKLRIKNFDSSFIKHECVALLTMMLSKQKHKDANIYSEYQLVNGEIADVVIELSNGDLICYEIQKEISSSWERHIRFRDKDISLEIDKPFDTIVIKLKELPNDLIELENKLKELII